MDEPRTAHSSSETKGLPELYTPTDIAALVGVSLQELNWWVWILPVEKRYRHFAITKRDGTARPISAPIAPLKAIQRKLADEFTRPYRAPAHVHGFTLRRSPKTNAAVHVGQRWVFGIDITDFFPSITCRRVRGLFAAYPFEYPAPVARLLAEICCSEGCLPQGAPTSPIISNYICRAMDRDLARLAIAHRCYYSRYADDLVFSTDRTLFPEGIASHLAGRADPSVELRSIIGRAGFCINEQKTRLQITYARQRVTGLIVNEKVNVPRSYIRGLRAVLHIWRAHGESEASKSLQRAALDPNWPPDKPYPGLAVVLRGRIDYVGSVRGRGDPVYLGLVKKLRERDPSISMPTNTSTAAHRAHLYTEGPTDPKHLRAALEHFHNQGEFTHITLDIDEETPRNGHGPLREHLERLVEFGSEGFAVGVFDWDVKPAKDAVGPDRWRPYGDKVVAVGLARPPWRGEHDPLCIELLYEDSVLETKDPEGKRIYRMAEFNSTTSIHESESSVVPYAGKEKEHLIAPDVFDVDSHAPLARSKMSFALAIEKEPQSFPALSFEGFRPTFERIATALQSLPET